MMELPILSPEALEIAVNKWINEDWATRYIRLNRGYYKDILPVIAEAQRDQDRINALRWFVDNLEAVMTEAPRGSRLGAIEGFVQELKAKLEGKYGLLQ